MCEINDVATRHALNREDYAACPLGLLEDPQHYRRSLTVVPAAG